jgi:paraquat-inducible protein A
MRLASGAWKLFREGQQLLALVIFLVGIAMPLVRLLALLYVLLPLRADRHPPGMVGVFRLAGKLRPWSMTEIYLLGVIVAYVKLLDFAQLELGIGLFAFVLLILAMSAADAALDPHTIWERLEPQATTALLRGTPVALIASCHDCEQLAPIGHGHADCPRCGAALHKRKPESLARTWACLAAAAVLYVPANLYPILNVVSFGRGTPSTIVGGVRDLIHHGMWPIALIVFVASVFVPVMKMVGLAFLALSVQLGWTWRPRDRTLLYRLIEGIGRWSMIDVFMISILVALVALQAIATIEAGVAATAFAAVVVLTMLASASFDPRLIWDAAEDRGAARAAVAT